MTFLGLAGCTAATPLPAVTVTAAPAPAPTVTASPLPRTADSPLEPIDAWSICLSFLNGETGSGFNSFSSKTVTEKDGVFTVTAIGSVEDTSGAGAFCKVSGTAGNPKVLDWATPE